VRAGWPRTWLRLPSDTPGDITGPILSDALLHQRAIASTGPFLKMTVDGAQIGDQLVPKTAGQVTVAVTVDAPDWIQVDSLRIYVNGVLKDSVTVGSGHRPLFQGTFVEPIASDSWIVAFASGSNPLPTDVVGEYYQVNGYPLMRPWAITNPVFIDADNDGMWTPPPTTGGFPRKYVPEPFDRPAPAGCDPSEAIGSEAGLQTPEHTVMPLLY
jgi:hypothetical protein